MKPFDLVLILFFFSARFWFPPAFVIHLDETVYQYVQSVTSSVWLQCMKALSFLGSAPSMFCVLLIAGWKLGGWFEKVPSTDSTEKRRVLREMFKDEKMKEFFIILGGALIARFANFGSKLWIARERPFSKVDEAVGYSFPSGHATTAAFTATVFLWWLHRRNSSYKNLWMMVILLIGMWIGLSRIFLSVHWASDVLAGFLLGGWVGYRTVRYQKEEVRI